MKVPYHVDALSGDEVDLAFPLIQATWLGADLASWRDFVAFFDGQSPAGTLAVHDASHYICGVLTYRLEWDLHAGRIVGVHLFTAVDLMNSLRPAQALLDAVEIRASELGCGRVHIHLHKDQTGLGSRLRRLGLTHERTLFSKAIDRPPN
jgi:hypothetical protein